MITPKNNLRYARAYLFAVTLTAASAISFGQEDSSSADGDEIVTLSPFVVDGSQDEGYRATNTLAGSRINTNLGDIANSISVFTQEMIEDLGAVSEEDLMAYSSSATADLSDRSAGVQGITIGDPSFQFRLRGQPASRARNYFETFMRPDTYNTERFDESRGPNSILFGIGGAGGIVNTSTKRASTSKDFGSIQIKTGSRDLLRTHLDYNKAVNDHFGIRVNALYHDDGGWRPHEKEEAERLHLAGTIRFNEKSALRLETEHLDGTSATQRNFTPFDRITLWLENDRPTVPNGTDAANTSIGIGRRGNTERVTLVGNDGTFRNFQRTVFSVSGDDNTRSILDNPEVGPLDAFYPGSGAFREDDMETHSAVFETQLLDGLHVELAVVAEDSVTSFYDTTHNVFEINGEPGGTFRDGDANPYQGLTYIDTRWVLRHAEDTARRYRGTVSYSFDLGEKLGTHNLAALFSRDHTERDREVGFFALANADGTPAFGGTAEAGKNRLWTRAYVTDPSDRSQFAPPSWQDIPSEVSVVLNKDGPATTYNSVWAPNVLQANEIATDSILISGQSYFLNNRLVATYGWRDDSQNALVKNEARNERDQLIRDELNRITLAAEFTETEQTESSFAFGLVGKISNNISVLYNKAENFNIPSTGGELVPFGRLRPIVRGEGEDVGIMINTPDRKLSARIAYFESSSIDDSGAFGVGTTVERNKRILAAVVAAGGLTQAEADSRIIFGEGFDLFDQTTTGWEARLHARPTKNWDITINLSDMKTVPTNMLKQTRIAYDIVGPQWASYDQSLETTGNADDGSARTIEDEIIEWNLWFNEEIATEGITTLGTREFQGRLFTRYKFTEGSLKGFFVGGGFKYSGAPAIGRSAATGELFRGSIDREVDLLFGYRTKVSWFGDGKQTLSVQINAQNLLQQNDFIGVRREEGGNLFRARVVTPARYTLTTKLAF